MAKEYIINGVIINDKNLTREFIIDGVIVTTGLGPPTPLPAIGGFPSLLSLNIGLQGGEDVVSGITPINFQKLARGLCAGMIRGMR